ncbi:hypothetical protein ABZ412_25965 [Nocardia sp. NPDC005746]|uniref:hypothetical protein n=1 Tax=Nocardia sp. NPDC005746 TaxID=3157062 RepID=UPI003410A516
MRFNRLFAAVAMLITIAFGAANSQPAQADTNPVVMITVWNGTGAAIGLINPADGQHTTRAKALRIEAWDEAKNIFVPTDGSFVVVYAESCLHVPGSLGNFSLASGGRYNVQLGLVWFTSTLKFTRDGSNPPVGVQVAQNSTGSSCSGL